MQPECIQHLWAEEGGRKETGEGGEKAEEAEGISRVMVVYTI